jgi:uncharacterized protein with FMN-binding domain
MKRGLLIGVGTLGGLGAVFAITPPQFGSNTGAGGISGALNGSTTKSAAPAQTQAPATQATSAAPTPTPTKATASKTSSAAKKAAAKAAASKAASNATKASSTPTPAAPTPTKASTTGATGTFAGATNQTRFGPVQVQITVSSGKITAVKALQYPNGDPRSANISQQAIPYLVQQTLAAQSDQISGVGGASYTSYGFYISLQSALKKAGL